MKMMHSHYKKWRQFQLTLNYLQESVETNLKEIYLHSSDPRFLHTFKLRYEETYPEYCLWLGANYFENKKIYPFCSHSLIILHFTSTARIFQNSRPSDFENSHYIHVISRRRSRYQKIKV